MLITDIPVWDSHSSYNRISAVDPVLAGLNASKRSPLQLELSNVADVLDYRRWTKQIHVSYILYNHTRNVNVMYGNPLESVDKQLILF